MLFWRNSLNWYGCSNKGRFGSMHARKNISGPVEGTANPEKLRSGVKRFSPGIGANRPSARVS
jgi:hypothetical protein